MTPDLNVLFHSPMIDMTNRCQTIDLDEGKGRQSSLDLYAQVKGGQPELAARTSSMSLWISSELD
jgi:hypothetical protein